MVTTPTLTTAIARLCAVMGSLPFGPSAVPIEQAETLAILRMYLQDAAARLRHHATDARRNAMLCEANRQAARIADAHRADAASSAASWLAEAVDGIDSFESPELADMLAAEALRVVAWPEAQAIVEEAGRTVADGTTFDVLQRLPALDAAVRAHRQATGEPVQPASQPECAECHEQLGTDGDCPRAPGFTQTTVRERSHDCAAYAVEARTGGAYVDLHGHTCGQASEQTSQRLVRPFAAGDAVAMTWPGQHAVEISFVEQVIDSVAVARHSARYGSVEARFDVSTGRGLGRDAHRTIRRATPEEQRKRGQCEEDCTGECGGITSMFGAIAWARAQDLTGSQRDALRWCGLSIDNRPPAPWEKPTLVELQSLRDLRLIDRPFPAGGLTDLGRAALAVLDAEAKAQQKGATT